MNVRFLQDGADIPQELIEAVRDGNAVFLCGAGVSFRVGLPTFKRLTEQVYERLGEAPDGEPAERNALKSKEYDRALRSLEKRTHRPGTESRLRMAVAELLAAPAVGFPDHRALLQLSKDSGGRPKVLTTNFDTLFSGRLPPRPWSTSQAMRASPSRKPVANAIMASCTCMAVSEMLSYRSSRQISY